MRAILIGIGTAALAIGASDARAQVVQLPTYRYFSTSSTVSVPDGGSVYLGGVGRAAEGSTTRGLPFSPLKSRGIGRSIGSSSVSVHATIIDNAELDAAVLAEAARRRGERSPYGPYRDEPVVADRANYSGAHVGKIGGESRRFNGEAPPTAGRAETQTAGPPATHAAATVHAQAAAKEGEVALTLAEKMRLSEVDPGAERNAPQTQP